MCNHCNLKKENIKTDFKNDAITTYIDCDTNKIRIDYASLNETDGTTMNIYYCPMCGRKL